MFVLKKILLSPFGLFLLVTHFYVECKQKGNYLPCGMSEKGSGLFFHAASSNFWLWLWVLLWSTVPFYVQTYVLPVRWTCGMCPGVLSGLKTRCWQVLRDGDACSPSSPSPGLEDNSEIIIIKWEAGQSVLVHTHTHTHGKILNISYSNVQSQNSGDKLNLTIYALLKKTTQKAYLCVRRGWVARGLRRPEQPWLFLMPRPCLWPRGFCYASASPPAPDAPALHPPQPCWYPETHAKTV